MFKLAESRSDNKIILISQQRSWTSHEFYSAVHELTEQFRSSGVRVVVSLLDNSPEWAVLDKAVENASIVHVPIPLFFSKAQLDYVLHKTKADGLLIPSSHAYEWIESGRYQISILGNDFHLLKRDISPVKLPDGTSKITFTSGTTGSPKGVCLSQQAMQEVADSVESALATLKINRHLSALPYSVLLENVAGLMASIRHEHTCISVPLSQVGLSGSSQFDPSVLDACVRTYEANSLILLPQMLLGWTQWLQLNRLRAPACLSFVAVGGSSVGRRVIETARSLGIPAYEGYGLSEGASVQTLNLPGADRPDSVGKPLPHAKLRTSAKHEIEISGSLFLGYLGEEERMAQEWYPTGDLGSIDAEGFVHITGRSKNVIITSFGRNISPEWVESKLHEQASIGHAVVFGNDLPTLWAVIWALPNVTAESIDSAIATANLLLPDYAQIKHWVRATHPYTAKHGMTTDNGRPLRTHIETTYFNQLTDLSTGV